MLSGVLAALTAVLFSAPAAVAEGSVEVKPAVEYCSIKIDKAPAGEISPVVAKACSDVSIEDAREEMRSQYTGKMRSEGRPVAAGVIAMHWYSNINYNRDTPGRYSEIEVPERCDTAGYSIVPESDWQSQLSSIVGNYGCVIARVYNIGQTSAADFGIRVDGDGRWLGAYSDNVGRIQFHA